MSNPSICILDYGSGNVRSVFNMVNSITPEVVISNDEKAIAQASHLILPGVGAYSAAMTKITERLPLAALEDIVIRQGKPFLGICVGMQVLAQSGNEGKPCQGLGWLDGNVERVQSKGNLLPHIGWNDVSFAEQSWFASTFEQPEDFYFVHSYAFQPCPEQTGTVTYGEDICVTVEKDNLLGVQFHPEKSQLAGKRLLQRFFDMS